MEREYAHAGAGVLALDTTVEMTAFVPASPILYRSECAAGFAFRQLVPASHIFGACRSELAHGFPTATPSSTASPFLKICPGEQIS